MANYVKEIIASSGICYVTQKYRLPNGQEQFIINRPNAPKSNGYLIRVDDDFGRLETSINDILNEDFHILLKATADGELVVRAQMIAVSALEGRLKQDAVFRYWGSWRNAPKEVL